MASTRPATEEVNDLALIEPEFQLSPSGRVLTAGPEQEDGIFELLLELQKHQVTPQKFPHRPEKVLAWIKAGTQRQGGIIGIVLDGEGHICASVGLFIEPFWWSDCLQMVERWLFVRPENRRDAALYIDLFEYMSRCRTAMERDLKAGGYPFDLPLISSHATGGRIEAKDRLWARFGERIGSIFLMR